MSKSKGSRLERELIKKFYDTGDFIPLRAAGSGSTPLPSPDLLVGGNGRVLAIECKGGKGSRYIDKEQISELKEFAEKFGAEAWVGARFNNTEWLFLKIEDLKQSKTGNNFVIDVKHSKEKGIRFEELVGLD
ncbi:Holliday junction resolvase [Candidatus Woesearchaeota archaeon]|nr:Holliday junction resolvase [Candidatus Woesearchaeota archaeon]